MKGGVTLPWRCLVIASSGSFRRKLFWTFFFPERCTSLPFFKVIGWQCPAEEARGPMTPSRTIVSAACWRALFKLKSSAAGGVHEVVTSKLLVLELAEPEQANNAHCEHGHTSCCAFDPSRYRTLIIHQDLYVNRESICFADVGRSFSVINGRCLFLTRCSRKWMFAILGCVA